MVSGTEIMNDFHPNQLFLNNIIKPDNFIQQDQYLNLESLNTNHENIIQSSNTISEDDSHDEILSDMALNYINQILMDEDDKVDSFHEYSALQATENSFYQIIKEQYPPPESNHSSESPDSTSAIYTNVNSFNSDGSSSSIDISDFASQSPFPSSATFTNSFQISDFFIQNMPAWCFNKGVEEARKFLPSDNKLVIDLESNSSFSLPSKLEKERKSFELKTEKEEGLFFASRGRKNHHSDDYDLEEGRSIKHSALSPEESVRTPLFDDVLLCNGDKMPKAISDLQDALRHVSLKNSQNNHESNKGSKNGKGRGKKQPKKEVVDLRTLLVHCAQMVSSDDQRNTTEILKQIRQHSSPLGDGTQRLAHYFANGIEARLAGTGSEIYNSLKQKRRSTSDFLKAYKLFMAASPFRKITYSFANQTIMNVAENASSIHVVDFGICFGFQWPAFFQWISRRVGGPPKIRITGIDFPQAGYRPAERIEETGRRLADYAKTFGVDFEYKPIASKWEDVRIEDIEIKKGEMLIVNCLFDARYLADETMSVESPRNTFLNLVRRMKPVTFIHGILNGSYSAPFFVTRFREALYHFSAVFDMLETIVPREDEERLLIEREIFGREIMNVIACEGLERIERPETYKQWQLRTLRAGFQQNPLSKEMLKKIKEKVTGYYHKDFDVDEYNGWMLQGWKGRIVFALSTWKPVC